MGDDWDDAVGREASEAGERAGAALVASGGWSAPSDTVQTYSGHSAVALPEVAVTRGGASFDLTPEQREQLRAAEEAKQRLDSAQQEERGLAVLMVWRATRSVGSWEAPEELGLYTSDQGARRACLHHARLRGGPDAEVTWDPEESSDTWAKGETDADEYGITLIAVYQ